MQSSRITIRKPTAAFRARETSPTFNLDRPIKGLAVGIRTDQLWRSWLEVADVWTELLKKDGAVPAVLHLGEHTGEPAEAEVQAWADRVDCAVVGLAN